MIAERANCPPLEQHGVSGRQLRNHILLANALAWLAIIILIRALFF